MRTLWQENLRAQTTFAQLSAHLRKKKKEKCEKDKRAHSNIREEDKKDKVSEKDKDKDRDRDKDNFSRNKGTFECEACGRSFNRHRNLLQHIKTVHLNMKEHRWCTRPRIGQRHAALLKWEAVEVKADEARYGNSEAQYTPRYRFWMHAELFSTVFMWKQCGDSPK